MKTMMVKRSGEEVGQESAMPASIRVTLKNDSKMGIIGTLLCKILELTEKW